MQTKEVQVCNIVNCIREVYEEIGDEVGTIIVVNKVDENLVDILQGKQVDNLINV